LTNVNFLANHCVLWLSDTDTFLQQVFKEVNRKNPSMNMTDLRWLVDF